MFTCLLVFLFVSCFEGQVRGSSDNGVLDGFSPSSSLKSPMNVNKKIKYLQILISDYIKAFFDFLERLSSQGTEQMHSAV